MKATARYVLNVEIESDGEKEALFDCHLFANHLHRMLDMYSQIGDVCISRYWIGDDEPKKEVSE